MNKNTNMITLLGMSGVGKTYISSLLSDAGLPIYSCDYEIGTKFLAADIRRKLGVNRKITMENISLISDLVGQVGNEAHGGLPLNEFKHRQALYKQAETASLHEALSLTAHKENLVIDSTGSLCEIADLKVVSSLGQKTLFVYLQASKDDEAELIKRAQEYPKPLYFPADLLDGWIDEFLKEHNLTNVSQITPNDFSSWVFPKLLHSRLPKYQNLADQYGVTIPAAKFRNIKTKDDFFDIIKAYT